MSLATEAISQGIEGSQGAIIQLIEADPTVQRVNSLMGWFVAGLMLVSTVTVVTLVIVLKIYKR